MSLIEYLESDDWMDVLCRTFGGALEVLASEPFQASNSTAVDDLSSWLHAGGVSRLKMHLNNQMDGRRFPAPTKVKINEFLEQLLQQHQEEIEDLVAKDRIPLKDPFTRS